jgi:hypothetical protein
MRNLHLPLSIEELLDCIRWRPITEVSELQAVRIFPLKVVLACWYGGTHSYGFTIEAEYQGGNTFARLGGGPLGTEATPTHWCWPLPTPSEADMLRVALHGKFPCPPLAR